MSNFPAISPISSTFLPFDLGLGRPKKGVDYNRENEVLGTIAVTSLFNVATIGATVANTTVQALAPLPSRCYIPKIVVCCTAINATSGHSFNIVLGTGAYTASATNVPGNDNVDVPPVAWNAQGQATGTGGTGSGAVAYAAGGGGIGTNPATAGQSMFTTDVVFNTTNFPNLTTGSGTGATYGQILIPSNPYAIWPNSGVLTLRVTTPGVTGSITNLVIWALTEPLPLSPTYPNATTPNPGVVTPGLDF